MVRVVRTNFVATDCRCIHCHFFQDKVVFSAAISTTVVSEVIAITTIRVYERTDLDIVLTLRASTCAEFRGCLSVMQTAIITMFAQVLTSSVRVE